MSAESVENGVKIKANDSSKYRSVYSRSFKVEKGEYYNITYTVENENPTNVANVALKNLTGKDFSGFTDCVITGSGTVSKTFLAQDSGYVKPHLYASMKTDNGDYYVIYKNVMISKVPSSNVINVEYEPYKSNILSCLEPVELGSVCDVQDTLNVETGEVVERTKEIVVDGTQSMAQNETQNDEVYYIRFAPTNYKRNSTLICDKLLLKTK